MKTENIKFITYSELLKTIENKENHLLLGNGFNHSLEIDTSYENIVDVMKKEDSLYCDIEDLFIKFGNDIEMIIGYLKNEIKDESQKEFLSKFIHNKIKTDFMKATSKIAVSQVNNVYDEKNEEIFLLLKNFNNYFTLNYDPFLYLLLMKFKKDNSKKDSIILQKTLPFKKDELNSINNDIYNKIKKARDEGSLIITINHENKKNTISKQLKFCKKTQFLSAVESYFELENWTKKEINKVIDIILKEEDSKRELNIYDGFFKKSDFKDPIYDPEKEKNVHFLHGVFHVYQEKGMIYKLTQKTYKPLYEKIEEVIDNEEKEVVCVFSNKNKMKEIRESKYLFSSYQKLLGLSGAMVIIGSSLAENDLHIFEQISNSQISTIYIPSKNTDKSKNEKFKQAKKTFPTKEIILFDRETISYKKNNINL